MLKMRLFFNSESSEVESLDSLKRLYGYWVSEGEIDPEWETFGVWLNNACSKNGALREIKAVSGVTGENLKSGDLFYDWDAHELIHRDELRKKYCALVIDGEIDDMCFSDWLDEYMGYLWEAEFSEEVGKDILKAVTE